MGSDGHRKLLQREGVAYTLRYGPALIFTTPNLADNKQPLLLIVQGEPVEFDADVGNSYREMTERLAADPVGQAIVFELMMRLFFTRVLGIRPELIGWRRGNVMKPGKMWHGNGVAADFRTRWLFGPIAAAFGPVEAQGRGSLHPHILIWLLLTELSDLLVWMLRDRGSFKLRLNMWMRELVASVASVQESAVTQLPQTMQPSKPSSNPALVPPLPFGPNERRNYHADGAVETAAAAELGVEGHGDNEATDEEHEQELYYYVPENTEEDAWQTARRPDLPLRNNAGEEVTEEEWKTDHSESDAGLWTKKISEWASGKFPTYRLGERTRVEGLSRDHSPPAASIEGSVREAVPSEDFLREMCHDARDLVIGCAVHLCSPSCFKYHSKGKSQICRHNFYHVVSFVTEDYTEIRRRRKGKPLRACLAIVRETQYGMAGRILTFQMHPWECPTTYAGMVALRCNLDVQDLRRTLPPHMWMPSEELEPETTEEHVQYPYMHGAYPQRVKDFSLGPQENWGWLQHIGTTDKSSGDFGTFQDWRQIFKSLAELEEPVNQEELAELGKVYKACTEAAHMAFVDNHNAGYYINSYTTKLNPTLDNVLKRLMESVRRLQSEWQESEAAKLPRGAASEEKDERTDARRENFRRTMQVLSRFESSFRRASWKSGCEMAFPILFGHLSFTTHRCWTVYMRKAIFLAAEAWRQHYGQLATGKSENPDAKLDFNLPSTGETITLKGWRSEIRQGDNGDYTVYISPEGESFDSLQYAHDSIQEVSCNSLEKTQAIQAMRCLLAENKEGHILEPIDIPVDSVTEAASRGGKATG